MNLPATVQGGRQVRWDAQRPTRMIPVMLPDQPIRRRRNHRSPEPPTRYEMRGGGARVPVGSVWCRSCGNVPVPEHRGVCKRCAARNANKRKRNKKLTQRLERRNPPWQLTLDLP